MTKKIIVSVRSGLWEAHSFHLFYVYNDVLFRILVSTSKIELEVPQELTELFISKKGYITRVIQLSNKDSDGYTIKLEKYKYNAR